MGVERTTLFISAGAVQGMLWESRKDAYQKGLESAAGYPLDVAAEIAGTESFVGRKLCPMGREAVADIIALLNREYEAGRRARDGIAV